MGGTAIATPRTCAMRLSGLLPSRRKTCGWACAFTAWVSLLLPCSASALEPAAFNTVGEQFILTPHLGWFMESGAPMTLEEVQARFAQGDYAQGSEEWLELGMMQGTMWLGMTIRN